MRYVVLGSAGQLGRDICSRLTGEILPLTRADADLTNGSALRAQLTGFRPDTVINCAAYNFVDRAEEEPNAALAVNTWAARELAHVCRDLDCTLVHFSTDQVFGLNTRRNRPYAETDAPGPVNVYGLSKLTGEYFVTGLAPKHFVVRTCGLYGRWGSGGKGGNFVETILRRASEGKPLRVVADQFCTPSYTVDVAAAVVELIQTERFGLYHLTNDGACSWFEFAQAILGMAGIHADLEPITSEEYAAAARRPHYSVLANLAWQELGREPLRPWKESLAGYLEQRSKAAATIR